MTTPMLHRGGYFSGPASHPAEDQAHSAAAGGGLRWGDGMGSRFISAVAFYGPKTGHRRDLLAGVQALVAKHVRHGFRPYSLDHGHSTLLALHRVREPPARAIL